MNPTCLNCGTVLSGPFCSECGQRDIPPYPSTKELVVEAVSEFSGWDGRLASTLRMLVRAPGKLTIEFLEGRRARYISPLRLYLTASVIYFLLAASSPNLRMGSANVQVGGGIVSTSISRPRVSRPQRVANGARRSLDQNELSAEEKASAIEGVTHAPAFMRPFLRRAILDPVGFKRGIFENMPRLLFVLLPAFAAIIALFYRHRKYPEHLYFALHLYAFIFIALAITELSKFTRVPIVAETAAFLTLLSVATYATLAFRRVYGGTWVGTIVKEAGIGLLYTLVTVVAFVGMIFVLSVAGG